jgi:ADP-heptose:LPS heptosyltransferase
MILLHLKAKPLRNGGRNAKNYPFINKLKSLLKDEIVEIKDVIPFEESIKLVKKADNIICIDSYLGHLAWYIGKKAIVIFSKSDPVMFGHKENLNLLKDRKYLRPNQFTNWENEKYEKTAFVKPEEIIKHLC